MKPALICFVEGIETDPRFQQFISKFEDEGYEPYVFIDSVTNRVRPEDTMLLLEQALGNSLGKVPMLFLSNIRNLIMLVNRLYPLRYRRFILFGITNAVFHSPLSEPIYQQLLLSPIQPNETAHNSIEYYLPEVQELPSWIPKNWIPFEMSAQSGTEQHQSSKCNLYRHKGKQFVFDAIGGRPFNVIELDERNVINPISSAPIDYRYPYAIPVQITSALAKINHNSDDFINQYEAYKELFDLYADSIKTSAYFEQQFALQMLEDLAYSESGHQRLFILSFLLSVNPSARLRNQILRRTLEDAEMTLNQKFFVFYQCIRRGFIKSDLADTETNNLQRQLYRQVYEGYKQSLNIDNSFIPRENRDQNFVIVMAGQILTLNHAPTKTALDRCYALIKSMNKKILLINTKELLSIREVVPFYDINSGNVISDYEQLDKLTYKDVEIPYYQPKASMPDLSEIFNIVEMVKRYKPYFILSIGSANLTADLCSNLVPTLDISTPYFNLPITEAQFPVIGRTATESDRKTLIDFGKNVENLIESVFTFDFKPQSHSFTRNQLDLPLEKTLLLIVGYRLNDEVSESFLQTLMETTAAGTHFVFVGGFTMETWSERFPSLKKHATNLGFQDDILAVMDLCDVYVNPKRAGGGTSVVEAMCKAIPAVTLPFGDVSTSVPDAFRVGTYNEMKELIIRYATDKSYYEQMSKLAKDTAAVLMNTQEELKRIVHKAETSPDF